MGTEDELEQGEEGRDGGWEVVHVQAFAISENFTEHPNLTSCSMYH